MDNSNTKIDFDAQLHGGVREIICEIAHYIGLRGWQVNDPKEPKVISVTECEIEVFHPALGKLFSNGKRINVKAVEDPSLTTFCKEYYVVEIRDLSDEHGVNKVVFNGWTIGIVSEVEKTFLDYNKKSRKKIQTD